MEVGQGSFKDEKRAYSVRLRNAACRVAGFQKL